MESKEQPSAKTPEKADEVEQFNETMKNFTQIIQKITEFLDPEIKFEEMKIKQDIHDTRNPGLILEISFRHKDKDVKMETLHRVEKKIKALLDSSKWKNSHSVFLNANEHKIEMMIDLV